MKDGLFKEYNRPGFGKGSKPRPVDKTKFRSNFSSIKWGQSTAKSVKVAPGRTIYTY